ncbi:hypothetical protein AMJ39_09075 [candidate division TA06 bacterium DG_24]|uniref:Uncharacterized protein n=3 Tax=Bacteria division TA06 TaxID=1156500 RepID=A0A0S8JL82_UNCT6|nr:MAG: hypothetical protein AMJ39_09075 [candidate division TA06 bacterium DG_24]KPK66381.1 MAG: hypothetical protein AMJ82_11845 [candidate division TA06 bacterium SM23_40]KPL09485.1 MAG: hypothetical protein AMJ71_06335 [candidate division TA06 bacterium SM1_40]
MLGQYREPGAAELTGEYVRKPEDDGLLSRALDALDEAYRRGASRSGGGITDPLQREQDIGGRDRCTITPDCLITYLEDYIAQILGECPALCQGRHDLAVSAVRVQ